MHPPLMEIRSQQQKQIAKLIQCKESIFLLSPIFTALPLITAPV